MLRPVSSRPVIERVVEQHTEEAAFLWLLRDRAVVAPNYARRHLRRLDERVEAQVDGLRVAGEAGWRIAHDQLEAEGEAGELFTAGVLALECGEPARIDAVVAGPREMPDAPQGLIGAIAWCPPGKLAPTVRAWATAADPLERYLALCAFSVHRADPGRLLAGTLDDADPRLRARALRLTGEIGKVELHDPVLRHLEDPEPEPAFWAAWSAVLLGDRGVALSALETLAEGAGPRKWRALELAARAMGLERGTLWARALNGDPAHRRLLTALVGHLGDPAVVPWLIGRMGDPELARIAGESFSLITGVDLAYADLERDAPEGFASGPTDDPDDPAVAIDPDDKLPWPDPVLLAAWWKENAGRLSTGTRHLLGQPISGEACARAAEQGYQRQRRAAMLEASLLSPAAPLGNWAERHR